MMGMYARIEIPPEERKLEVLEILRDHPEGLSFNKLAGLVRKSSRATLAHLIADMEQEGLIVRTPKRPRRGQSVKIMLTETVKGFLKDLEKLHLYDQHLGVQTLCFQYILEEYDEGDRDELLRDFLEKFPIMVSVGFAIASTLASHYPLPLKGIFFWRADRIWEGGLRRLRDVLRENWSRLPPWLRQKTLNLRLETPKLLTRVDPDRLLVWFRDRFNPSEKVLRELEQALNRVNEALETAREFIEKEILDAQSIERRLCELCASIFGIDP